MATPRPNAFGRADSVDTEAQSLATSPASAGAGADAIAPVTPYRNRATKVTYGLEMISLAVSASYRV